MKKSELLFSAMLVPADFVMLVAAGVVSYAIRFTGFTQDIRPVVLDIPFGMFFGVCVVFALVWIIVFALSGLYEIGRHRTPAEELSKIFLACSTGALIVVLAFFFSRTLFSSRFIILASWILAIVFVSLERGVMRFVMKWFYSRGIGVHRMLLIGSNHPQEQLVSELQKNKSWGYRVTSFTEALDEQRFEDVKRQIVEHEVDEVLVADVTLPREMLERLIALTAEYHVIYKYFPGMVETQSTRLVVDTIGGVPVVEVKRTRLDGWGRVLKRLFDIVCALAGIVLSSPIWLIVAMFIKLDTPGPVFIKLTRVGARGQTFELYKFRSMVKDAHKLRQELLERNERADGPLFKMKNDPRVTRVGRVLRSLSIDELPQLINVLKGEMSLVGPRPHEPGEVSRYQSHHRQLLNIKPGMTGMAQVSGRSGLRFEDEVALDVYYIQNWSLWLDVIIIAKTPFVVLKRQHAV